MISYLRGVVQSRCALGAVVMLGSAMAMPIAAQAEQTAPMRSAAAAHSEAFGWKNVSASVDRQIQKTQSSVRQIYAQLNRDAPMGGDGLLSLSRRAEQTLTAAQTIQTQVTSYRSIYESYLGVVGEKPVEGESADITDQRKRTQDNLQDIKSALTQSKLLELQARQLQIEIQRRNTQLHQALLSEQIDSPLTPAFWSALTDELPNDKRAFAAPSDNGYGGPLYRWPYFLAALGVTFLVLVTATRPLYLLLRKGQTRITNRFGQHEEASTSTIPIVINGFLCAILAAIVWEILSLVLGFASESGTAFMQGMVGSLPICGFVIGAGLPLLSRATLRDRTTPDVPRALRGSDWNIALIVLVQNVLLVLSQENIFGLTTQRLLEAIFALIVSTLFVATCRRLNRATDREDIRLAPAVRGIGALLMLTSWVAVALGYVAFAFTTVSWCVSIGVGIAVLTLMSMCLKELTTRLLSPGTRIATRLSALGVGPSHVAQAGVLISGIGNVVMLVILIAIALSDGKFDLPTIAARLHALFIGQSVNGVQVSLNKVVICIGILIAAYYGIRQISRWLDQQLFPTTRLDLGAQNSIRNIFTYVAWIGVFLVVLSEAGLTVKNLTWVVSALSVGIGFGLQSIVQNFVSGIILLAERPIRVGDSVEISGKTGDVKRISVRSTDIGLPDGSTLIVPNSQFITSPVRNATLGGAQGAVATSVTISPRANALLAQDLLAKMMASRTDLLATPAPGVAISAITELGTTLALSGRVGSARDVGGVTNAIMRDAYATLQAAGVELGKPS